MRHIDRSAPPEEFVKFGRRHAGEGWKSLYKSDEPLFRKVCDILAEDQLWLSGYTEMPLRGQSRHVDHFLKQEYHGDKTFDWDNLVVDANSEAFGAKRKDRTVSRDENGRLISPVSEDPHDFFRYQAGGRIVPRAGLSEADAARARLTIEAFGLNDPYLQSRRAEAMLIAESCRDGGLDFDAARAASAAMGFPSVCEAVFGRY